MNFRRLLFLLSLAMACCTSHAGDSSKVRDFVGEFYGWYVPAVKTGSAFDLALKSRASAFDPLLARMLKEDSDAKAKAGELIGLDFDPFLASQDPCDRYEVVGVRTKAENYLVDVRGVGGCEKHDEADVTAEVVARDGALLFVNFHYPRLNNGDLLTILKQLRNDR